MSVVAVSLLTPYEIHADQKDNIKEALFQAIKESDKQAALEGNLQHVTDATAQQLLEAKVIWAVFRAPDTGYFDQLLPQIEEAISKWNGLEAIGFLHPAELQAIVFYMAALKAQNAENEDLATIATLKAFWLEPLQERYAALLAAINPSPAQIGTDLTTNTAHGGK